MGAENSSLAYELLEDDKKLILPFTPHFYNPLRLWTVTKKRKRGDPFTKFVNSPTQIMAVYAQAREPYEYVDRVFTHFNQMDMFQTFWKGKCNTMHSSTPRVLRVVNGQVDTDTPGHYRPQHDAKFIESAMFTSVVRETTCFIPMYLQLEDDDGAHANMALLTYDPGVRKFSCLIFEPHATFEASRPTIGAVRGFIHRTLIYTGANVPDVNVWSPWTKRGLQGDAPVCLQWSLFLFFTYMVNCVLIEGVCDGDYKNVVQHVFTNRNSLMPIWMYHMWEINKPPEVGGLSSEFESNSEIDAYNCHLQDPCRYPCAIGKNGNCLNKKLFTKEF